MIDNADSDAVDENLSTSREHSQSPEQLARESDELACKLAYESGWKLCEDSLRTLDAQRTRAFTLLLVTVASAGIALSAFVGGEVRENLDALGNSGLAVFAFGALLIAASAAAVAWPIETEAALRPSVIVKNYVTPKEGGAQDDMGPQEPRAGLGGSLRQDEERAQGSQPPL